MDSCRKYLRLPEHHNILFLALQQFKLGACERIHMRRRGLRHSACLDAWRAFLTC